jgi:hypothetical protein
VAVEAAPVAEQEEAVVVEAVVGQGPLVEMGE